MASTIRLDVKLNQDQVLNGLKEIAKVVKQVTTPAKLDIDTKLALTKLKDLNAIASNLEKQLNKPLSGLASGINDWDRAINTIEADAKRFSDSLRQQMQDAVNAENAYRGMASSLNVIDSAIQTSETASRNFSDALRQQMQDAVDAENAYRGMASTMTVIDRAIQTSETASRNFSEALRQQMQAEVDAGQAAESASGGFNALSVAMGNLAARAVHFALRKITQGIREAVNEMKEVDTQLTNISKVSGITGKALSDMGERAYETASKYGVAADEYLAAVYTFQKAGLNDSAEAMGELAVKTMLVGDTTADVATQFLISANAAWKFGGDMERLGQIVDEADYINNNYATDLGKLSSGLPRVASIAAQAGMSAEETLAALGTITAVTQESGTKAATALRALILNIEGQVGEFVDDTGETFTVTEESVKSMEGLMNKYAKAELEAAKASGELINPMTAIKAIFEGMANSDLNDQELFQLLSGMGGKLRANQLTALVQNYELFDEMLERIAGSAGTADSEISLMMESWERKTQVLKNTWTEFVADFVSSDTIKKGIEGLTSFIDDLDTVFFKSGDKARKTYESLEEEYEYLKAHEQELNNLAKTRLRYLELIIEKKHEEAQIETKNEANKWLADNSRMVLKSGNGYKSGFELNYEALLSTYEELGTQLSSGAISADQYTEGMEGLVAQFSNYYEGLIKARDAGAELNETEQNFIRDFEGVSNVATSQIGNVKDYNEAYQVLVDTQGHVIALLKKQTAVEAEAAATAEEARAAREASLEASTAAIDRDADAMIGMTEETQTGADTVGVLDSAIEAISFLEATAGAESLTAALEAASQAAAGISVPIIGWGGSSSAAGTTNAPGGPTLVNELGPELISENGRAYIANGGRPGVVNLSRGAIVLPAAVTKQALRGNGKGRAINAAAGGTLPLGATQAGYTPPVTTAGGARDFVIDPGRQAAMNAAAAYNSPWTCPKCKTVNPGGYAVCQKCGTPNPKTVKKTSGGGGGKGGGGGSGSGPSISQLAKDLSNLLSNLDKQAKLANNEGDYVREAQIYEQAQEAIKKMVDDYRRAGYADDSDEILDLLNKNYDYANKQLSLYQSKWDELIKALEADTDAQEMANKLAEKQQAVEDAREALANAQRQRTVRMYNATTGQWEWVSDNKTVGKAQESLTKAEEAYAKELKSQAITELKNAKEAGLALEDIVLGPALSAVALMAEETDEFQNFARALNAVYGVGSFLQSTEGSSKVISTADSHDVHYTFGNVTLTEEQASSMSVAELAKKLSVLKIS